MNTRNNSNLIVRCLIMAMATLVLSSCGGGKDDLYAFINETKAQPGARIDPIPEIKPYPKHEYSVGHMRDPFKALVSSKPGDIGGPVVIDDTLCPDPNRARELLEEYALDSLRMVGTLTQDGARWALIRSPEGTVHRITSGNYMGLNTGKITLIDETHIEVIEIITTPRGCEERTAALTLEGLE